MENDLEIVCILANKKIRESVSDLLHKFTSKVGWSKDAQLVFNHIMSNYSNFNQIHLALLADLGDKSSILEIVDGRIEYYMNLKSLNELAQYHFTIIKFMNKKLFTKFTKDYLTHRDLDKFFEETRELSSKQFKLIEVQSLSNINVENILENKKDVVIPSKFNKLNESLDLGGYLKGSVNVVAAPPGKGKSQILLEEALHFSKNGYKVFLLALGDMKEVDFISRLAALHFKVNKKEVLKNILTYYNDEFKSVISNINFSILNPAEFSIYELEELLIDESERGNNYDVIMVDYDSNLKELETENMYDAHKIIYNTFMGIVTNRNAVGFIASQVKKEYFSELIIPEEALAESSKKQAIIDLQLMYNREKSATGEMYGVLNIAKSRRGILDYIYVKSTDYGSNEEITENEFKLLQYGVKPDVYTTGEVMTPTLIIEEEKDINETIDNLKTPIIASKIDLDDVSTRLINKSRLS